MNERNTYDATYPAPVDRNVRGHADTTLRDLIAPIVREIIADTTPGALMISQLNCAAVFGISSRTHLENCRRADFTPRVVRAGKMRLVDAAEYRAWLRAIDARERHQRDDEPHDGASEVLAELGLRERPLPRKIKSANVTAGVSKTEEP